MRKKDVTVFIVGVVVSYLIIYYSTTVNAGTYIWVNKIIYSDVNENYVNDLENYTVSFRVDKYWRVSGRIPFSGPTSLPYYFNLSLTSRVNEISWVEAPVDYYQVYIYNQTECLGEIISVSDPYAESMGIFLAPRGRHQITTSWNGKIAGKPLPDGDYEIKANVFVDGRKLVFEDIMFSVETKTIKTRTNLVY